MLSKIDEYYAGTPVVRLDKKGQALCSCHKELADELAQVAVWIDQGVKLQDAHMLMWVELSPKARKELVEKYSEVDFSPQKC